MLLPMDAKITLYYISFLGSKLPCGRLNLAKQWGWIGGCDGKDNLEKLIKLMKVTPSCHLGISSWIRCFF